MGKLDFVPQVLASLGVQVLFHKVRQKPGKPFWFGKAKNKKLIFALPGNPVSTQICAYRYVLPYLEKAVGLKQRKQTYAVLAQSFENKTGLTYFSPVKIFHQKRGKIEVQSVVTGGSGDYVSLAKADGFVELSHSKMIYPKGELVRFYGWR